MKLEIDPGIHNFLGYRPEDEDTHSKPEEEQGEMVNIFPSVDDLLKSLPRPAQYREHQVNKDRVLARMKQLLWGIVDPNAKDLDGEELDRNPEKLMQIADGFIEVLVSPNLPEDEVQLNHEQINGTKTTVARRGRCLFLIAFINGSDEEELVEIAGEDGKPYGKVFENIYTPMCEDLLEYIHPDSEFRVV